MFRERHFLLLIPLMILCIEAYSDTATQTDWSGGNGIWGPVFDWGNEFYADTYVECYSSASNLLLPKTMTLNPLEHTVNGDFTNTWSVFSEDVNGDGYMDVLGASSTDGDITWWENVDGLGTSWAEHIVDGDFTGTRSVYSEDVNGDGYMDVLGASMGLGEITWWENVDGSGISWTEHLVDGDFNTAISVYSADINGDSFIDVLGSSYNGGDITWWENIDGAGTSWTEHTVDGNFNSALSVYAADINGDGFKDVLGVSLNNAEITWWENVDGSGIDWAEHTIQGGYAGAYSVRSGDVNGDGFEDVLGAAAYDNEITWWENLDGSGTSWTEHIVDSDFVHAASVYSADVNADGWVDIMGAALNSNEITWWENMDGLGTSWTEHTLDSGFSGAASVYSADLNGDGWLDILGAAYTDSEITWWDLTEFLPDGTLESSVLDVQESPDWETLDWTSSEPSGTGVAFQVRASNNSSDMGLWSETLTSPCSLEGLLADEDNFIQYRVILSTTDSLVSPALHDVTVGWLPFNGTQEGYARVVASFALFGAQTNPSSGNVVLVFSLPVDSRVELTVYNLAGRAVSFTDDTYEAGVHGETLAGLSCGVYLVRMISEEFTATRHFVVIE